MSEEVKVISYTRKRGDKSVGVSGGGYIGVSGVSSGVVEAINELTALVKENEKGIKVVKGKVNEQGGELFGVRVTADGNSATIRSVEKDTEKLKKRVEGLEGKATSLESEIGGVRAEADEKINTTKRELTESITAESLKQVKEGITINGSTLNLLGKTISVIGSSHYWTLHNLIIDRIPKKDFIDAQSNFLTKRLKLNEIMASAEFEKELKKDIIEVLKELNILRFDNGYNKLFLGRGLVNWGEALENLPFSFRLKSYIGECLNEVISNESREYVMIEKSGGDFSYHMDFERSGYKFMAERSAPQGIDIYLPNASNHRGVKFEILAFDDGVFGSGLLPTVYPSNRGEENVVSFFGLDEHGGRSMQAKNGYFLKGGKTEFVSVYAPDPIDKGAMVWQWVASNPLDLIVQNQDYYTVR